jgi:hypothetical protein
MSLRMHPEPYSCPPNAGRMWYTFPHVSTHFIRRRNSSFPPLWIEPGLGIGHKTGPYAPYGLE